MVRQQQLFGSGDLRGRLYRDHDPHHRQRAGRAGIAVLLAVAAALGGARGEPCPEPTIVPFHYTTADAVISSESIFVVEIALTCRNGAQNVALYADVNGKQFPVTRGQEVGRYQVSWSMEHRGARSGTY
ncbi:Translocon-associated protein subunit delta [Platysternon megacephalum]|uniref:Translocon-associated protein subunit delta n=1 Tax=Platysternon megacephalum TaxID=55544 RepID=A0A4D9E3Z2_9SAUR|nr:Translocon-associated protein subunit delta [Platysternon megacephalum]